MCFWPFYTNSHQKLKLKNIQNYDVFDKFTKSFNINLQLRVRTYLKLYFCVFVYLIHKSLPKTSKILFFINFQSLQNFRNYYNQPKFQKCTKILNFFQRNLMKTAFENLLTKISTQCRFVPNILTKIGIHIHFECLQFPKTYSVPQKY